jgi:excinuclease ABC subunit C
LKFHLGGCQGVCQGRVSPEEYRKSIDHAINILAGRSLPDYTQLEKQLENLISEFRYEEAAEIRDIIAALKRFFENQKVEFVKPINADIWGLSETPDRIVFSVFFIRGGKLLGNRIIDVEREPGAETEQVLASVMQRFYDRNLIPPQIHVSCLPEQHSAIAEIFSDQTGRKVVISLPERGQFRQLLDMAVNNAFEVLKNLKSEGNTRVSSAVLDLQQRLQLAITPERIECIDISHIQGVDPVASLVVAINGQPRRSEYRLFHIKEATGGDDPASIAEVVRRRLERLLRENQPLPELLIVDGGITQVRAAEAEVQRLGLEMQLF